MAAYLRRESVPCEMLVCGTCGGSVPWLGRLGTAFPEASEIAALLCAFTNEEITEMANRMPVLIHALDPHGKQELLRQWTAQTANDPAVAESVEEVMETLRKAR
jgi:hypothetical protein